MKILSIGNSYSQDAHRYLKAIADKNGEKIKCVNLFIGGCTLKTHYLNCIDDEKVYMFFYNGENTNLRVSVREALKSDEWDYVTLQQGSHESFKRESYEPYIYEIVKYVKKYAPHSKILLHQTWAYPDNKERLAEIGFETTGEMFSEVKDAYEYAADAIKPAGVIKSGEALLKAYELNKDIVYRDAIHASLGFGRYLLGLIWYKSLFGKNKEIQHIDKFDVPVSEEEKQLADKISEETTDVLK